MTPEQREAHLRLLATHQHRTRTHECFDHDDGRSGRKMIQSITEEMVAEFRRLTNLGLSRSRIRMRLHCGYVTIQKIADIVEAQDADR